MSVERIAVGDLEVFALLDADGTLDVPITDAFPGWPPGEVLAYRQRYPGVYGPGEAWRLHVRAWLVRHPGGSILVDTGIGVAGAPGPEWFGSPGHLGEALADVGAPPEAIDTVAITHVHDDHVGGTVVFTTEGDATASVPAFANARHVLQRADLEWERRLAKDNEEDATIWSTLLQPLEDAGLLDPIDGDVDLVEGVTLHHLPGHTPGHQIVRLDSGGERAVICADAFNHPAQLSHPEWPSGQDADGSAAGASRRTLLAQLATQPGIVLAPTHFGEAFGELRTGPDGLPGWVPRPR